MSNAEHPHDTAIAIQFALSALRRSLGSVGVFDGEAGDEVHGTLALIDGAAGRIADQLDPAFVSISPRHGTTPRARLSFARRGRPSSSPMLRLVHSRGDRAPGA